MSLRVRYEPDEVAHIIANPLSPIFVYEDESGVVEGYCFCIVEDHTDSKHLMPIKTLYIDDLCVNAECRGKHIGTRLYNFVKEYAKENGFYNITLNVWQCNPSAMKFYESIGLTPLKVGMEEILGHI
ncbi:MAG: GNAT family N-acetyltransferase, partial [Muribaculaceae bacterium]|nr:GNAT family N-acetyltransferase [Muribaculaceae bacterium]